MLLLLLQQPGDRPARAGCDRAGNDRSQAQFGDLSAALRHHRAEPADQDTERAKIRETAERIGDNEPCSRAERLSRQDLDPESVQRNLAYYETLRRLSPEARTQAIQALGAHGSSGQSS